MGALRSVIYGAVVGGVLVLAGCGHKKEAKKPTSKAVVKDATPPPPPPETEADREAKRATAAAAIIPDGSTCLPESLKQPGAPRLELGAVDNAITLCAIDQDKSRLLGPVGCFTVDVGTNALTYKKPAPIPGLGFDVKMDDHCARGFCLPAESVVPADQVAHITWNIDGTKVAVLAGDMVHLFDAGTKAHESAFAIRGDKGVVGETRGIDWVAGDIFVVGGDKDAPGVWVFKAADGTAVGAIEELGGKPGTPLLMKGGALSILDKTRIGLSQAGLSTLTVYDTEGGKRAKAVRKVPKAPCKPEDMDAYWKDPAGVADAKCKDAMDKAFGYFVGASGFAGSKNLVFALRGPRLGELGLVDPKSLTEQKKVIKLPFCEAGK